MCIWHAVLLATASSSQLVDVNGRAALQHGAAEAQDHKATRSLSWQHAAPSQPAAAAPAAPPDAGEPAVSSTASLPLDILVSAARGELPKVVKWLRKERAIDALCSVPMEGGQTATTSLLHAAARHGQLEMVKELLRRGASVDLPGSLGFTALVEAATFGHPSIVLLLLQHSANSDLQTNKGVTALMGAAGEGHEACVSALLRAGANTELLDNYGRTALQWAETKGHTATATLLGQHASCLSLCLGAAQCAAPPPNWSWVALSVLLGAVGVVASRRTLTARPDHETRALLNARRGLAADQDRAARQRQPHRNAQHAKAQGRTITEDPSRQHAAPPQPAAAPAPRAKQAARSKKSNEEKGKAGRASAAGSEPSEAPPPVAPAPRAAIPDGGQSALEEGGVGAEAAAAAAAVEIAAETATNDAKAITDEAQAAAKERAGAAAQAVAELAEQEQAEEDRLIDEAMARRIASLQADEERRRTTASPAAAPAATPPTSRSPGPAHGEPSRAGRGGRGGSGVPRGGRGGRDGSGVGGDGGATGASSQAVLSLADAGDITGRPPVPESTIGGETTCNVCMVHPKSHIAVPCGHLCVCGVCAERMQYCPYCRAPVQQWMHARVV